MPTIDPLFSPAVRELFAHWERSDQLDRLETLHRGLIERRQSIVEYAIPGDMRQRTISSCMVLQQALLHRAERLLAGSGILLIQCNIYALALSVRGHVEAAAVLGYLCNRLGAVTAGNIPFSAFAYNIVCSFLGAKHPDHFAKSPNPPNILTCIEKADDFLRATFRATSQKCLRDIYDWLSEFAHASNFLSHSSSFIVDTEKRKFVFRHDAGVQESDFELIGYLEISAGIFPILFDHLSGKLKSDGLA